MKTLSKKEIAKLFVICLVLLAVGYLGVKFANWLIQLPGPDPTLAITGISRELGEVRTEVAVLSGKLEAYELLINRQGIQIEILEKRYDNLSILQRSVDGG